MSRRISLLFISKSTGGVGSYVRTLVENLDHTKFDITAICMSEDGEKFASELNLKYGIQTYSLAMNRYKINPFTDLWALIQLAILLRKKKYDIIHAHASKPGFLARIAAIGSGIPVIYSPHNFAFHEGAKRITILATVFLEKFASIFTKKIITVAQHEKELALHYAIGSADLYEVVPTGINASHFQTKDIDANQVKISLRLPSNAQIIGSVGRLAHPKMPLDFVAIANLLHKEFPNLHFIWVGSGPLEEEAKKKTESLGLNHIIHWLGHRTDMQNLYSIFDIFVLLSRWEGNPLVILEAFAAEIPVIATNNLGTKELINSGENGFLYPIGDTHSIASKIRDLIQSPDVAKPIIQTATKQIDTSYSLTTMINTLEKIYIQNAVIN
ncbi:MAG: group 1 glycosyl transferase [Chloroflexi bacterium OLB14]|nr:MAG: group 1 glycosyl transferase [Chloroflexi bacterium OLB14]